MNDRYRESLINFKNYIKSNMNIEIKEINFNIQDLDEISDSLHWLENIKFYHRDYSFIQEKVYLFKYIYSGDENIYINNIGNYIAYISSDEIDESGQLNEFVEEIEFNRGIFLAMFLDAEYYPVINYSLDREYEVLDILDLSGREYSHHEFKEVIQIFNKIKIFKIKDRYLDIENNLENIEEFKFRFLGMIKCSNKLNRYTNENYFSEEVLKLYNEIFRSYIDYFPYDNLYFSLSHNSPKYIFLEVYRLYEKIYPIIYCKKVKEELGINEKDVFEISNLLKTKLLWRPDGNRSLNYIFEYGEKLGLDKYINNLKEYKDLNQNLKKKSVGCWIYEIRNELVHLSFDSRNSSNHIDISKVLKDDIIIRNLLPIIVKVYENIFN